ncbi:PREDICTED: protein IWS1 homolog [Priapulus caudatus]|uniref:Protein IWS1 homolog n=1 Tax=Priapulus caudatus TaxID=37621 RepID=A0ABM1EFP2_PRICU|nr:PREDICTED: protein IWS1 homolog [Priapulus caudatus]
MIMGRASCSLRLLICAAVVVSHVSSYAYTFRKRRDDAGVGLLSAFPDRFDPDSEIEDNGLRRALDVIDVKRKSIGDSFREYVAAAAAADAEDDGSDLYERAVRKRALRKKWIAKKRYAENRDDDDVMRDAVKTSLLRELLRNSATERETEANEIGAEQLRRIFEDDDDDDDDDDDVERKRKRFIARKRDEADDDDDVDDSMMTLLQSARMYGNDAEDERGEAEEEEEEEEEAEAPSADELTQWMLDRYEGRMAGALNDEPRTEDDVIDDDDDDDADDDYDTSSAYTNNILDTLDQISDKALSRALSLLQEARGGRLPGEEEKEENLPDEIRMLQLAYNAEKLHNAIEEYDNEKEEEEEEEAVEEGRDEDDDEEEEDEDSSNFVDYKRMARRRKSEDWSSARDMLYSRKRKRQMAFPGGYNPNDDIFYRRRRTFRKRANEDEDEDEEEEEEEEENNSLYSPERRAELMNLLRSYASRDDGEDDDDDDDNDDECPAVEELSTDCEIARRMGAPPHVQQFFGDICRRHEVCYTCGSQAGISARECDRGFLGEAEEMCSGEDEEACILDAGKMLVAVVRHEYLPGNGPATCRRKCVYDYIVGEDANDIDKK